MADPAHDEESLIGQELPDDAQPGAKDPDQTPGDPADARPDGEGHAPDPDGDDSPADSDPLALAQQESAPVPKKDEAAKPTPKPEQKKPPTQPAKNASRSDTPDADDDATLKEALEDIPEDDWKNGRLTHKAKSQFLSQRKAIRRLNEQVAASKKISEDLDAVEKLRQEQGLEPEEFVNAAILTGAMKRGDARAIPYLEQHLANLRKRAGIPDAPTAPPQAPAFDPTELLTEIEAAQANYDFDRLDRIKAKLTGMAKGAPPVPPAQQQQPPPTPPQASQQRQQEAPNQAGAVDGEALEFNAMSDALSALGVANPVDHVRNLIATNPELGQVPPGQRLRAVLAKHREVESAKSVQQRRTTGQPISGRGVPQRAAVNSQATNDPLKHAMRR